MMNLKRDEVSSYGAIAVALALFILVGGLGFSAITSEKHYVSSYQGYSIYRAPDSSLNPNPKRGDGEYFYVKGHWSRAFTSGDGARDYAHDLWEEDQSNLYGTDEPKFIPEPDPDPVTDPSPEPTVDTKSSGQEMKAHFTVQKKLTTNDRIGHSFHTYTNLKGVVVNIFKGTSKTM